MSYDRWDAEHQGLLGRVVALEGKVETIRTESIEASRTRGNRVWLIGLGLMTAFLCPLVVATIIALLHLSS